MALCPQCGREVQFIQEDNWFFRLSAYQDRLLDLLRRAPATSSGPTRAATRW